MNFKWASLPKFQVQRDDGAWLSWYEKDENGLETEWVVEPRIGGRWPMVVAGKENAEKLLKLLRPEFSVKLVPLRGGRS